MGDKKRWVQTKFQEVILKLFSSSALVFLGFTQTVGVYHDALFFGFTGKVSVGGTLQTFRRIIVCNSINVNLYTYKMVQQITL